MDSVAPILADPRAETFGYVCHRCMKCCHHKRIQLNPYEAARLARNRGMTTGEFRAVCTEDGAGLALGRTETGACVFLGSEGCTVHADRPLVCRFYPLGRRTSPDGAELWLHVEPHPQSRGEFTRSGTIADFLVTQDAHPFMRAADEYYLWLCAAHEYLRQASDGEVSNVSVTDQNVARDLLDMDATIARHCAVAEVRRTDGYRSAQGTPSYDSPPAARANYRGDAMSKNDKPNASNMSGKGQINRVGTSALIAAASLLGTALGVSDAMAKETHVTGPPPHASNETAPSQDKGKGTTTGKATFLKYELKNVAIISHAKKPSNTKVVEPVVVKGKK